MAENRTINIKINQNADKAEQSFKSYNKELGNTKKQYDAVLKSGKPFDQQLEDINRIVKETPLNVRDMNKQIQAYQSIALSAGRETPVGRKALEEAAKLRDRYIDIQNETKRLADDQRTLEGAMQGVATGVAVYGGIQSAMALSGVESEKLRETLVKLQAAQTLMNSINQVATAFEKESALMLTLKAAKTKAVTVATAAYATVTGTTTGVLKAFRIALASTGIGLLVVGIGLLIANFDKVTKVIKNAIDVALVPVKLAIDAIVDAYYAVTDALGITSKAERQRERQSVINAANAKQRAEAEMKMAEERTEAAEKYLETLKETANAEQRYSDSRLAALETQKKLAQGNAEAISNIDKQITDEKIAQLEREKAAFIEEQEAELALAEEYVRYNEALEKEIQAGLVKSSENFYEVQAEQIRNYNQLKQQLANEDFQALLELDQKIANVQAEATLREKAELKKRQDNYKKYLKDQEALDRQIQDAQLELQKDGLEKDLEANRIKFERQREQIKGNGEKQKELRSLLTDLELKAEQEIRLKYFNQEKELLGGIIALNTEVNNKRIEDNKKAADSIIKTNEKARQQDLANEKIAAEAKQKLQEAQIANVEAGIALFKDLAGENKKLQAIGIAAESAASIAKTIITTQAANAAATAQGTALAIPTLGASVAAAAAAVVQNNISAGISIAAQIAAAAKGISQLGGGASPPSGSAPSGGGAGGGDVITPEFNVVGESGINQLAQLQQQPLQAYVVSGEVTTGQALDRNRVQNATL